MLHRRSHCNRVQQDYIYKIPISLHANLQREPHNPYFPPTSVTWLQLLRKQSNTGTSTTLVAETCGFSRTLTTCDINLWSLTLRAPETGDFVGLILLYLTSPTGLPYFQEFDDHRSTETFPSSKVESVETSVAEFGRTRRYRFTPTLLQPSYRSVPDSVQPVGSSPLLARFQPSFNPYPANVENRVSS